MTPLTCAAVRRRLQSFHDRELQVSEQIAVDGHLEWCDACAEALEDLQFISTIIRAATRGCVMIPSEGTEQAHVFRQSVISRLEAEEGASLSSRIQGMFEDLRLVYAGLGAAVAAVACLLMMLNVMRSATDDRTPGSLAALMKATARAQRSTLASMAGAHDARVVIDARLLVPGPSGVTYAADSDSEVALGDVDAEFALMGVVTRTGRVANLELVRASTGLPVASGTEEAVALRRLMGAVARGRYEPARVNGLPVAVNKVWMVAHTTVHASKETPEPVPSPAAKKRLTEVAGVRVPRPA